MKFCTNCGQQIDDNAKFCAHCGTTQSVQAPSPRPNIPSGKRLHCPKCRGAQLSPIVETDVQGGYSVNRSFGRKWGASAVNLQSTHRDYWMCSQCGHKFRNIDSLEEEIAVQTKARRACLIFSILFLVASLLYLLTDMGLFLIFTLPALILFVCLWLWIRNKVTKLTQEKEYLEVNCFN